MRREHPMLPAHAHFHTCESIGTEYKLRCFLMSASTPSLFSNSRLYGLRSKAETDTVQKLVIWGKVVVSNLLFRHWHWQCRHSLAFFHIMCVSTNGLYIARNGRAQLKSLVVFLSPTGMSLTKLSLAGNNLIVPGQGEFGKWHPRLGREKLLTFFTIWLGWNKVRY